MTLGELIPALRKASADRVVIGLIELLIVAIHRNSLCFFIDFQNIVTSKVG